MSKSINSSVQVARLLNGEGYTEFIASQVRRYWKRKICFQTDRAKHRIKNLEKAFSESIAQSLTGAQRQILGKFISLRERQGFDAGLRIGLTVRLYPGIEEDENGKPTKQTKILKQSDASQDAAQKESYENEIKELSIIGIDPDTVAET